MSNYKIKYKTLEPVAHAARVPQVLARFLIVTNYSLISRIISN